MTETPAKGWSAFGGEPKDTVTRIKEIAWTTFKALIAAVGAITLINWFAQ